MMVRRISYLLVLLPIFFLQACAPPVKPPGPDLVDRLLALGAPAPEWKERDFAYAPPDDAPIEDLLGFWEAGLTDGPGDKVPPPTPTVQRHLLSACVDQPKHLVPLLSDLPQTPQALDVIHSAAARGLSEEDARKIRDWLMTRSKYGRGDLIAIAAGEKSASPTNVEQPEALEALAKLDWATAELLLRKFDVGQDKVIAAAALNAEYQHAVTGTSKAFASALKERLENISVDRTATLDARRRACTALLAMDWDGRDEWIISLLDDPQLAGSLGISHGPMWANWYTDDVFAQPIVREPERFLPALEKLAGDANTDARLAADIRLVQFPRADALRPILGILTDDSGPKFDEARRNLLTALGTVEVPESIPFLSKLAAKREDTELADVAVALARQHAPNAPTIIDKALSAIDSPLGKPSLFGNSHPATDELIKAAVDCGALSDEQIVTSIEAYAATQIPDKPAQDGSLFGNSSGLFGLTKEWSHDACIGSGLISPPPFRLGIVEKLLDRWAALRNSKPELAAEIWKIVIEWPVAAIDDRLAKLISDGPLDEAIVTGAVARAAKLREREVAHLRELTHRDGSRAGLAVALLADREVIESLFDGSDVDAERMLLAAARLARTPLPIPPVAHLMDSSDARLSHAAERYLSCEDSPQARRLVLARHPGEELILGARWESFPPDPDPTDGSFEAPFRQEMLAPNSPDDIYVMAYSGMGYFQGDGVVRVRGNSATLELHPGYGPGKILTRNLLPAELRELLDFLARTHFDDLPQLDTKMVDGPMSNYLHLTRTGGRRVFMHGEGYYGTAGSPHFRLKQLFTRLAETGTYQTHYPKLQQAYPATQVLFGDRNFPLNAVWKGGDDLLVSQGEKDAQAWHVFHDGKLAEAVAPPAGFVPTEYDQYDHPENFFLNTPQMEQRWRVVAGDSVIIWEDTLNSDGFLYRWRKPQPPMKVGNESLADPVTTYDGKWLMAMHDGALVGINLADEKMHSYTLPTGRTYSAEAYVPILDKMVVEGSKKVGDKTESQYWLVDPAEDKAELVKGDFEPLLHTVGRMIPSTTNANEVWLTNWDDSQKLTHVIRYDLKTWKGTEVLTLPDLRVTNDRLAIDEKGGAAYIVIFGDLLRVPLGSAK